MLEVKLVGANTCNRFKLMREIVLDEAARVGIGITLVEENEATGILKYRTAFADALCRRTKNRAGQSTVAQKRYRSICAREKA